MSATVLWLQIIKASYIYNPTIYIFRHTTELLLKGLILNETMKTQPTIDISKVVIQESNTSININSVHSLLYLWENYKQLNKNNRLAPCYSPQQEQTIDSVIKFFNDKDFSFTTSKGNR